MSAQNLQRLLGLRRYNTAWLCLHELRRAMVRPGRERLSRVVEVDETHAGGPAEGKRGRGAIGKKIVVVAAERKESVIGRIRLCEVPNVGSESLKAAVLAFVEPGSMVVTDGWSGYNFLPLPDTSEPLKSRTTRNCLKSFPKSAISQSASRSAGSSEHRKGAWAQTTSKTTSTSSPSASTGGRRSAAD